MVAGVTLGRPKFAAVREVMQDVAKRGRALSDALIALAERDAEAYAEVMNAYRLAQTTEEEKATRGATIQRTLLRAAQIPLETAQQCVDVVRLAEIVARDGNPNAVTDAGTAAALAEAACRAASYNVRVNVRDIQDAEANELVSSVREYVEATRQGAARVAAIVDGILGA
jgi:glutamate formiminotransferase/formiminotetrahydrofolate cyclodeaminase